MITIIVYGITLQQSTDASEYALEVSAPTTIRGLLETNRDRLAALVEFMAKGELIVTVNRKVGTLDSRVQDGDTIRLTHQFNPTYEGARWHNP
jgi:molybdopterin synthase sulfur carrier subunit